MHIVVWVAAWFRRLELDEADIVAWERAGGVSSRTPEVDLATSTAPTNTDAGLRGSTAVCRGKYEVGADERAGAARGEMDGATEVLPVGRVAVDDVDTNFVQAHKFVVEREGFCGYGETAELFRGHLAGRFVFLRLRKGDKGSSKGGDELHGLCACGKGRYIGMGLDCLRFDLL